MVRCKPQNKKHKFIEKRIHKFSICKLRSFLHATICPTKRLTSLQPHMSEVLDLEGSHHMDSSYALQTLWASILACKRKPNLKTTDLRTHVYTDLYNFHIDLTIKICTSNIKSFCMPSSSEVKRNFLLWFLGIRRLDLLEFGITSVIMYLLRQTVGPLDE